MILRFARKILVRVIPKLLRRSKYFVNAVAVDDDFGSSLEAFPEDMKE